MKTLLAALTLALFASACSHPLEIVGDGDILSASGDRDCLLEDHAAASPDCTENIVTGDYLETYYGVPRAGWHFHRWANYCGSVEGNACGFDVSADAVDQAWGVTVAPLVAIFRPDVITGFNALLIGHSFFHPFSVTLSAHADQAGFDDHQQSAFFSGGASGAPQALWEDAGKRGQIQSVLDGGDIELFGMTYHPDFPSMEGYRNWVNYALARNPDTRFFIGLPWLPFPAQISAAEYEATWHGFHPAIAHGIVDTLRSEYPGVDFYCIPYGQSAVELRNLFAADDLPEVETLVGAGVDAIYLDSLGHADNILLDLGALVWLRAIYGVDLDTYPDNPAYQTNLRAIGQAIIDGHDQDYNAPWIASSR